MYEELKKRRLELGKTLEEISEQTKIKKYYLHAIEEGKFNELPIEIYSKSYIKIYSESLNINPLPILKEYEEYLKTKKQTISKIEDVSVKKHAGNKIFTFLKHLPKWAVTVGIIFFVILFLIVLTQLGGKDKKIPTLSPITEKTVSETTKIEGKIEQTEQKQEIPINQQTLQIEATDKVWMRIIIDDKEKREFFLNPGQKIQLKSLKSFKLHIGNAGGVKVFFNERDLGELGKPGQVVHLNLPQEKN